jgi:enoyl-CoA hydratase
MAALLWWAQIEFWTVLVTKAEPMTETVRHGRMVRWVKGLMVIWRHWRDVEMLASFDDRMLADIGLTRADRHDVLDEPRWRDPTTLLDLRRRERILARMPKVTPARRTEEVDMQAGHNVFEPILLREDRGAVAVLTLNRPAKMNALNNDLLGAMMELFDRIELSPTIRAVVITGAGRAFSAGADINAFQQAVEAGPAHAVANFMRPGQRMTRRVEAFPKPIIAAVNGLAFGGGCELVESTHIALAADTASFCKAEINIGIIPTFGGTQRLPRNIGRKAAIELILSGRIFDAAEAARLGLVNRVVSSTSLLSEAIALAELLATKPPLTTAAALSAIHRGMDAAIDDGLAIEEAAFARIVPTDDAREGIAAFVEKRPATFLGR